MSNTFIPVGSNMPEFRNLTPEIIKRAESRVIKETREALEQIYAIAEGEHTYQNTIVTFDQISDKLNTSTSLIYLMAYVHPDEGVRNEANERLMTLSQFSNELSLDEKLYQSLKAFSKCQEARNLANDKKLFLTRTIDSFERNGFALPAEKRDVLKNIKDKLAEAEIKFSANISNCTDFMLVDEEGMKGLPEDYKASRKQEEGNYKIDLSSPSYVPFMKYAFSDELRKKLYTMYLNRAVPNNLETLDEILKLRLEMANVLGHETYADWALQDKMAKDVSTVWSFENELQEKVKQKAQADYNELLVEKKQYTKTDDNVIYPWEASFYNNLLLKNKYQLDQEEIKKYFQLDNLVDGLFAISKQLFHVEFRINPSIPVWHEDVKCYDLFVDNHRAGHMYLDLFPRPNKYNHAACFSLINGYSAEKNIQHPSASLVCNFPRPTVDKPSLLSHSDVETFFHEFGHLLHYLLSVNNLSGQNGFAVAHDFVEVPSQFFEHWSWNYESLSKFAKHYKTGEMLPKALFDKMYHARNVGSGIQTLQQIFYGSLDLTLHHAYTPSNGSSTTDIVKELQNQITLYPYLDGTHMQASFGHLTGYAAGYYGYLWARVYAEDLFTPFETTGILNTKAGLQFRNLILAKGASTDEMEMICEYLGREPETTAFLRYLGV
jgi:thimet oligopeptidase